MNKIIHLYVGDGKGKTTAAVGLAVRAAGSGRRVVFAQFLKGSATGEIEMLKKCGIKVIRNAKNHGFFSLVDEETRTKMREENNRILNEATQLVDEKECDFLILDEVIDAYRFDAIEKETLDRLLLENSQGIEVVMTGRQPPKHLVDIADYFTEMRKIKHPYDKGVTAREGVEY